MSRISIPTNELDFDFLKVKVRELLNDAVASAILFDEKIIKNGDEGEFEEMPSTRLRIGLDALANGDRKKFNVKYEELVISRKVIKDIVKIIFLCLVHSTK